MMPQILRISRKSGGLVINGLVDTGMQPSEKQLIFARDIAKELDLGFPSKLSKDKKACSAFIQSHKDQFYKSIGTKNKTEFNPGKPFEHKSTTSPIIQSETNSPEPQNVKHSVEREIIQYWHEGLIRTAFEGFGTLSSELKGVQSFTLDKIDYVLNNFECDNLTDVGNKDGLVRHLVMFLESVNSEQSKNMVLMIFPLMANFNEDNNNPHQERKIPYEWQRSANELPIFNQRLLGEEAEYEGLMLHNSDALDTLLTGSDGVFPENAHLQCCLDFIDLCFNVLTEQEDGCAGWIKRFEENQKDYPWLRNKKVRFNLVDGSAVSGATRNIRLCYAELMSASKCLESQNLSLFRKLLGREQRINPNMSQSFTIEQEQKSWSHLNHYVGHMDNHAANHRRLCYSLDPSQRIALTLFKKVTHGSFLAVNGPPGTGKTSLLRAVIADEWIRTLLSDSKLPECPIIIACAATNQAVTNIISSFDSVPGPLLFNDEGERTNNPASLESRWLPHLISYGWYQPASISRKETELQNFQVISRKSAKRPWDFHFAVENFGLAEKNLPYLEYCYLKVASEFFNCNDTISEVAHQFRNKIKDTVHHIDDISDLLEAWIAKLVNMVNLSWNYQSENQYYALLKQCLDWESPHGQLATINDQIENIRDQLPLLLHTRKKLKHLLNPSIHYKIYRFFQQYFSKKKPSDDWMEIKKSLAQCDIELPSEKMFWPDIVSSSRSNLNDRLTALQVERERLANNNSSFKRQLDILTKAKQEYLTLLGEVNQTEQKLLQQIKLLTSSKANEIINTIQYASKACRSNNQFDLDGFYRSLLLTIQNWLDINIRPKLFHLSARYWEARYLLYKQSISQQKDYSPTSEERLRELAMLAPVFVTTSYSAPKLMQCADENRLYNYLYGRADLLIVDEAGQSTSEIGSCTFAFAQRAIIVGDTQQLSPVWNITQPIDKLIHKKQAMTEPFHEMKERGLLLSAGSIMQMAQYSTAFYDELKDVRGVMLSNHYRCRSPIIEICNEMVYGGALSVVTAATEPKKEWRPPLGFLVVPGDSTRLHSGSRCNINEAQWIARWIKEQEASILAHYNTGEKNYTLADLVAVLTPFKGQVNYLRKEIAKIFGENLNDKNALANQMVVGTVHSLQGSERAIVLFSMVDSLNPADNHFYDMDTRLINVAISRAKEVFIVAMDQNAVNYGRNLTRIRLSKPSDYLFYHIINHGERLNSRRLLFIESPNKRAHLETALSQGMELEIIATSGHLTQLDISSNWDPLVAEEPQWQPISDKEINLYQRTALLWPDLEAIYIATDADAEGECIAWHFINRVQTFLPSSHQNAKKVTIKRMRFYNLVHNDIKNAYDCASDGLDAGLVKSALFRTLMDQMISRHYPKKLNLGVANAFHAGIGRVQLAILDIAQEFNHAKEEYVIEVSIPIKDTGHRGEFILHNTGESTPMIFDDPINAQKTADEIDALLFSHTDINLHWEANIEQLAEYPAINTVSFLALAFRTHNLPPQQVMGILQTLYEGLHKECSNHIMEQAE